MTSVEPGDRNELTLFSNDLLSKWGFNDGDRPDELLDYCDHHGIPYPADWHTTLRQIVRTYLLPVIDQDVEVYDIETSHNPIRASKVNGVAVDDLAGNPDLLTPESVSVPYDEVLRLAGSIR